MGHLQAQPIVALWAGGQPRRKLDVSRARERFCFESQTPFEDGLGRTIAWYLTEDAIYG